MFSLFFAVVILYVTQNARCIPISEDLGTKVAWRNLPNNVGYRIVLFKLYVGIILVMQRLRMGYPRVSQELLALHWAYIQTRFQGHMYTKKIIVLNRNSFNFTARFISASLLPPLADWGECLLVYVFNTLYRTSLWCLLKRAGQHQWCYFISGASFTIHAWCFSSRR